MADTKISALPAATTPLAGTEVLPIVQSGSTVKVSVANLTAGRAISATSVTATTGNFVVGTSGQGIDFSATPGTGTSELFSDYEEGIWTPVYTSFTLGGTQTTLTSTYTRIGRCVYIQATFANSVSISCTGGVGYITGYPFSPAFSSTVGFLNENTAASIGVGEIYATSGRLYPPTFSSTANQVIAMSGFYFV
jgi:hypothetical protein